MSKKKLTHWQSARAAVTLKEEAHFMLVSARAAEARGEAQAQELFDKAHTFLLHAARRDKAAGVKLCGAWQQALKWDGQAQEAKRRNDEPETSRCWDRALQCAARGFRG